MVEGHTLALSLVCNHCARIAGVSTVDHGWRAGCGVLRNVEYDVGGASFLIHVLFLLFFLFQKILELFIIFHALHLSGPLQGSHRRGELVANLHHLCHAVDNQLIHFEEDFFQSRLVPLILKVLVL